LPLVGTQSVFVRADHLTAPFLFLHFLFDCISRHMSDTSYIVRSTPKSRQPRMQRNKFVAENARTVPFELVGKPLGCQ
jgi:hypothetical protein